MRRLPPSSAVVAPDLTTSGAASSAPTTRLPTLPANTVRISATPAFGSKNVPPNNPVKISVFAGKITQLTMTGDDGTTVAGKTTPRSDQLGQRRTA